MRNKQPGRSVSKAIRRVYDTWFVSLNATHYSLEDSVAYYDGRSVYVDGEPIGYSWEEG